MAQKIIGSVTTTVTLRKSQICHLIPRKLSEANIESSKASKFHT